MFDLPAQLKDEDEITGGMRALISQLIAACNRRCLNPPDTTSPSAYVEASALFYLALAVGFEISWAMPSLQAARRP